jgi:hypothetical protein
MTKSKSTGAKVFPPKVTDQRRRVGRKMRARTQAESFRSKYRVDAVSCSKRFCIRSLLIAHPRKNFKRSSPIQPKDRIFTHLKNDPPVSAEVEALWDERTIFGFVFRLGGVALVDCHNGVAKAMLSEKSLGFVDGQLALPNFSGNLQFLFCLYRPTPMTNEDTTPCQDWDVVSELVVAQNRFIRSDMFRQPVNQLQMSLVQVKRHATVVQGNFVILGEVADL